MRRAVSIITGFLSLIGGCKKEDPTPQQPTSLTLQVVYQQSGLPVDRAYVQILGTKGTYLTGRQFQTFVEGYTDTQGHFQVSVLIPRDYYTTFTAGKLVKIGNHYKAYGLSSILPKNIDQLKLEQENMIRAELDTLP